MHPLARLFAVLLLAACQMQVPKPEIADAGVTPLASEAIAVTTLDSAPAVAAASIKPQIAPVVTSPTAIPVQVPGKSTLRPRPRPVGLKTVAVPATPAPKPSVPFVNPVSPEQVSCEKTRGQWSEMPNSSGHVCVHTTRDSGKSCRKKGECQGECLATSGTCSPIIPLVGCNDILQADGSQVTLCLQ